VTSNTGWFVTQPGAPSNFYAGTSSIACATTFTAPAGWTVSATLTWLDLASGDAVNLLNGPLTTSPSLTPGGLQPGTNVAAFSLAAPIGVFATTGNALTIHFAQNNNGAGYGAVIYVAFVPPWTSSLACPSAAGTYTLAPPSAAAFSAGLAPIALLSQPAGTAAYAAGVTCTLTLAAPAGSVVGLAYSQFSLAPGDTWAVYDGRRPPRRCSRPPPRLRRSPAS